jgi:hypothetical protein
MQNFSAQTQHRYNDFIYGNEFGKPTPYVVSATQNAPGLRGISWYLTGLTAQGMHSGVGRPLRDKFFLGKMMDSHLPQSYFPILIATKEPIGFLALVFLALGAFALTIARAGLRPNLSPANYLLVCGCLFTVIYLSIAISGKVTLGIRHLSPIFPFVYLLSSVLIVRAISRQASVKRFVLLLLVFTLLSWGCLSSISSFPGFLAYFNEFAGGKAGGADIVVDSNYDWGADMLRLKQYMDRNGQSYVYLLYEGTSNANYYLGDRHEVLDLANPPPSGSLVAISVRCKQSAMCHLETRARDNRLTPVQQIRWKTLNSLIPVDKAGDSILIYRSQ